MLKWLPYANKAGKECDICRLRTATRTTRLISNSIQVRHCGYCKADNEPSKTYSVIKVKRNCLKCEDPFTSESANNHVCNNCKKTKDWESSLYTNLYSHA